jgi:hypothetical protein
MENLNGQSEEDTNIFNISINSYNYLKLDVPYQCLLNRKFTKLSVFSKVIISVVHNCTLGALLVSFFRVWVVFIVQDPTVTVNCRAAVKALFVYFNLCLSIMLYSLSCSFTSTPFLTKQRLCKGNSRRQVKTLNFEFIIYSHTRCWTCD